jgi:hypothetical protein
MNARVHWRYLPPAGIKGRTTMEAYEWIELGGMAAILFLLWDMHGYLREISRHLDALRQKS